MADINTIFRITAKVSGTDSVQKLKKELDGVSKSGNSLQSFIAKGARGLMAFAAAGAAVGAAIAPLVKSSIDLADNLNDISQRTGVSVESLAKYKVAADNSGTSIEALAGGFNKLNKNLVEAQGGTGTAAKAFKAMGIDIRDANGNLKNADAVTAEIADRFAEFPDGPQKAALAMAVFGKSGADLIPLLNMGSEEISRFGLAIDQDFATAADAFNDKIGLIGAGISNFGIGVAKELLPALSDAIDAFGEMFGPVTMGAAEDFGKIMADVARVIVVGLSFVIKAVKDTIAVIMALGAAARGVAQMATGDFSAGKDTVMGAKDWAFQQLEDNNQRFENVLKENWERSNTFKALGGTPSAVKQITASRRSSLPGSIGRAMSGFTTGGGGGGSSDADKAAEAAAKWTAKQRELITTLSQEADYIGRATIEVTKLKDARQIDTEVAEKVVGMSEKQAEAFKAEAEAIKKTRQEILQANYEKSRMASSGAAEFFNKYAEDATNAAEQTKNALSNAFKGAEDALVEFTMTGKLNFRDLANSIIKDLARIMIQQSITGPLASALGGGGKGGGGGFFGSLRSILPFANGGIMTPDGQLPLHAYASGGVANSPQLAMFGEGRQPEAYVPLPDGRTIPVSMKGGGGQQNNVTVNVSVESGSSTTKADGKEGAQLGTLIAASVKSILINEKRPGGLLAAA